jgi:hypothetical protein
MIRRASYIIISAPILAVLVAALAVVTALQKAVRAFRRATGK